ncbi:MAG: TRAP transporter small permease [Fusobacteriaceae bacterium]|jgi:TRAP-type C4-dicarboxylate transport system permease small subunit|nr:TRAP transporter small permease [Fusobacteriaceae bacterium]
MKITKELILRNLEEILASFAIIVTTILVIVNVFLRYFVKTGLYWSEEVATGCFVWSVFLGAAAFYKRRGHVGVDIIVNKLGRYGRNFMKLLVDVMLTCITGYMGYVSIVYVSMSYQKPTPVLGISTVWISSSLMVSFVLMFIYSVKFLYEDGLRIKKTGKLEDKEGTP